MNKDFWKEKNVFVTGCLGFASSWIIIELLRKGAKVIGLTEDYDSYSLLSIEGYDKKICLVRGSITDYRTMERVFNQYEVRVCFHLAGQTIVGASVETSKDFPLTVFETNIKGTWNVLEAARNCKYLQAIVIASSDRVYGEQEKLPYSEEQILLGHYPYDASKICDEIIARSYFYTFNLPVGITRCANIYGGGDFHFSRIVPETIRSILYNEKPIIRSDGTPIRDYMYVEDAANGYITLAEAVVKGQAKGEAFNFSAEHHKSTIDIVKLIISISGKSHLEPEIIGKDKPYQKIDRQILSAQKAKDSLNWKAKYSLEEGLKKTFLWYEKYRGSYL